MAYGSMLVSETFGVVVSGRFYDLIDILQTGSIQTSWNSRDAWEQYCIHSGDGTALPDSTVPKVISEHSTMLAKTKAKTADIKEADVVRSPYARVSRLVRLTLVVFLMTSATWGLS